VDPAEEARILYLWLRPLDRRVGPCRSPFRPGPTILSAVSGRIGRGPRASSVAEACPGQCGPTTPGPPGRAAGGHEDVPTTGKPAGYGRGAYTDGFWPGVV